MMKELFDENSENMQNREKSIETKDFVIAASGLCHPMYTIISDFFTLPVKSLFRDFGTIVKEWNCGDNENFLVCLNSASGHYHHRKYNINPNKKAKSFTGHIGIHRNGSLIVTNEQ